jgi:Ca2+/Na+ antiporter
MRDVLVRLGIIGEMVGFLWRRKLYWLIPMVVTLLLFGLLIVLSASSGAAPFVYSLW